MVILMVPIDHQQMNHKMEEMEDIMMRLTCNIDHQQMIYMVLVVEINLVNELLQQSTVVLS